MALGPSSWVINAMWDAVFVGIPFVVNQVYIELHTGDPGSGGTANTIATIDRQAAFFERDADGHWRTTGAPMEVAVEIPENDNLTVTHISVHDSLDGGNWIANMIANQPISVVLGDLIIASDRVQWTVTDWIA